MGVPGTHTGDDGNDLAADVDFALITLIEELEVGFDTALAFGPVAEDDAVMEALADVGECAAGQFFVVVGLEHWLAVGEEMHSFVFEYSFGNSVHFVEYRLLVLL